LKFKSSKYLLSLTIYEKIHELFKS